MNEYGFNQKKIEYKGLLDSEKEINENLKKNFDFDGNYKFYGLIDHSWYQKYKQYLFDLINGKTNKEFDEYDVDLVDTKVEDKIFCFPEELRSFHFISNFEVVTKNFINLLSKNFKLSAPKEFDKIFLCYVLIGGKCLIRRDRKNINDNYITYYENNKNNNIDFWLQIQNDKQRKKHINIIVKYSLWYYLGIINYNFNDEQKDIFDEEGNNIGYFIRNCDINRSQILNNMKISNLINDPKYPIFREENSLNIELIPKLNSILACLSLFTEFKDEIFHNSKNNNDFTSSKLFANFFKLFPNNNYEKEKQYIFNLMPIKENVKSYFLEIIKLFEDEFSNIIKKEQNPKINELDENLGKNKFLQEKEKGSIIQKLFFSVNEIKIYCLECSLTTYNFE